LQLAFVPQASEGRRQLRIAHGWIFPRICLDVLGESLRVFGCLSIGASRLHGGPLLRGQIGIMQSLALAI
jgi:hypothetical protein